MLDEIDLLERRVKRLEGAVFQRKSIVSLKPETCGPKGGIIMLIQKGFFKTRRSLATVRKALEDHGYNYSNQVIHTALNRLAKPGCPLVVLKMAGKNVYVARK